VVRTPSTLKVLDASFADSRGTSGGPGARTAAPIATPTNAKGEFRLEGVAPGKYAVMTVRSNFALNPDQPKVYTDPVPFEVTDSDVNDLEVKAQRGLIISGVVITDGITNKAALAGLSRLIVSGLVMPNPTGIQTYTNSATSPIAGDGTFQLEGLRPGKVSLSVNAYSAPELRGYKVSRVVSDRPRDPEALAPLARALHALAPSSCAQSPGAAGDSGGAWC